MLGLIAAATADDRVAIEEYNRNYHRENSRTMMRFVALPTRASLDAAAYLNNAMHFDPRSKEMGQLAQLPHIADFSFGGGLLKRSIRQNPIASRSELDLMAWEPMLDYLVEWDYDATLPLLELSSRVSSEKWGNSGIRLPLQRITAAAIRRSDVEPQLWVEIELLAQAFPPQFTDDTDQDGVPELYAQVNPSLLSQDLIHQLQNEYLTKPLSPAEVTDYFYELSSDWYEKYNTSTLDLAQNTPWPNDATEPDVRTQLRDIVIEHPTAVIRGKPFGQPIYNVFVVAQVPDQSSVATITRESISTDPDPRTVGASASPMTSNISRWQGELEHWGNGDWNEWLRKVEPFRSYLSSLLAGDPPDRKGFIGKDGYLFFRGSINYSAGGDIQAQPNNPFPAIVDYARQLHAKGIDMLFVIIPAKAEIYPDKISDFKVTETSPYVNPYTRKFLRELADAGVEVVDLYPAFITERDRGEEPLYMPLDTHWTNRGVRLAAHLIAERIKAYPWYAEVCSRPMTFTTQPAESIRSGDIRGMLPEDERVPFRPMTLSALQVVNPDGSLYQDDPASPIVVLGDSFTGVYHFEDCKHAGVSAHIAREIGMPVDLIMAHGSGPKIRKQFARRGSDAISEKRLVIWTTAARDLYEYWSPWEIVPVP